MSSTFSKLTILTTALFAAGTLAGNAATVVLGTLNGISAGISNPGLSDSIVGVTGLGTGVSFDLDITPVGFGPGPYSIGLQNLGIGVSGGQANAGVDNDFNGTGGTATVATETLTFTINNVVGAAAITISEVTIRFGVDSGANTEFFSIDDGPATSIGSTPFVISLADVTTFKIGALDDDGITGSDSRFAVESLTLTVTPIPEPTGAALAMMGLTAFAFRRRRQ